MQPKIFYELGIIPQVSIESMHPTSLWSQGIEVPDSTYWEWRILFQRRNIEKSPRKFWGLIELLFSHSMWIFVKIAPLLPLDCWLCSCVSLLNFRVSFETGSKKKTQFGLLWSHWRDIHVRLSPSQVVSQSHTCCGICNLVVALRGRYFMWEQ